ncbi:unnamed protein product, partial [Staurois parvus]
GLLATNKYTQRHLYTETCKHTHRDTCTCTHTDTCIHTQARTDTHTHRYMYIHRNTHTQTHVHTDTWTYTHMYMHTHIHVHTHRHMYMHTQTHTNTHVHAHKHTHPIKSCSTSLFTHRAGYCTLGGGRERSTHSFLCFHCAQLLSNLTAPSANDRSGLSSEPAQQVRPVGHTRPHHNFHLPLVSRRVEIS